MPKLLSVGKLTEPLSCSEWHSHPSWEICLFTDGEGVVQIDHRKIPFSPGSIICYPPEVPHSEHSAGGCLISNMLVEGFTSADVRIPVLADSPDRIFDRLMSQLLHECQLKESGWEQVAQQLLQLMLTYLDRWRGTGHHPLITRLKQLIAQGANRPDFSLGEAMETLPMSKDHLRRLFFRVTGATPMDYLTAMRIDEAKRLMRVMRFGVKEASYRAGFSDPAYFARVFRKQTGRCPRDFLNSIARGESELQLRQVLKLLGPIPELGGALSR